MTRHIPAPGRLPSVDPLHSMVFLVHPDERRRRWLETLVIRSNWQVRSFGDAETFLSHPVVAVPACLVLDVDLPDIDGLDLQARLRDRRELPVIFVANHASVRTTVRAMKAGAVEFLSGPFEEAVLLDSMREALDRSRAALIQEAETSLLRQRFTLLSRREREVMQLVVAGRMNKHVAETLGIAEITVKVHRGRVMRKMRAASLPDLVNMVAALQRTRVRSPGPPQLPCVSSGNSFSDALSFQQPSSCLAAAYATVGDMI